MLISGLVITACALMYFFISRSAVTGLEGISDYVVLVTPDNSNPISINVDPKILIPDLENQIQNTKNNFLFQSMIATGIIILLSSICTWFVTRRALTPLRRFSDRIRQVQAQNLSEPLEVPLSEDEISRLTRSFNDMLARLDNAFSAQKQFVASAAHELRTPLAVMQTNLEVFYKKPEHAPQEYDRLFTMLQEQTGRLSHLAEILLDMTGLQTVERSDTISLQHSQKRFSAIWIRLQKNIRSGLFRQKVTVLLQAAISFCTGQSIIWLKMRSNITGLPVPLL
ncbi:MAG: HAMP domain-containing protein [Blautia wexlerae]